MGLPQVAVLTAASTAAQVAVLRAAEMLEPAARSAMLLDLESRQHQWVPFSSCDRDAFSSEVPVKSMMQGIRLVSRLSRNNSGLPLPVVSGLVAVKIVTTTAASHK